MSGHLESRWLVSTRLNVLKNNSDYIYSYQLSVESDRSFIVTPSLFGKKSYHFILLGILYRINILTSSKFWIISLYSFLLIPFVIFFVYIIICNLFYHDLEGHRFLTYNIMLCSVVYSFNLALTHITKRSSSFTSPRAYGHNKHAKDYKKPFNSCI